MTPALELRSISKSFGRSGALVDAGLVVRPGTIHAVLGENGAGKTTLMRIAYGMIHADSGEVHIRGHRIRLQSPIDAMGAGIGMVHQHFTLVPAMTVAENVALGGRGLLSKRELVDRVLTLSALTGFALDPQACVEDLPVGAQQRVEIAKALSRDATILILDEPTAVLAPRETDDLLRWLRAFVANGRSALLVTHKLNDALAVADDVTVFRNGRNVYEGRAATSSVRQLTAAMMGSRNQRVEVVDPIRPVSSGLPVFRADGLSVENAAGRPMIHNASFIVHAGERLGVVAVEGSGQRELLRVLAGRMQISGGVLERPSVVGFVPEDRHADALLLDGTVTENIALKGAGRRHGVLPWKEFRALASYVVEEYDVRAKGPGQKAHTLSGGNQQKLIVARELEGSVGEPPARALVVENPTRGLDVNAAAAVHRRLVSAANAGIVIVFYSSDLDEVLAFATRVLVVYEGVVSDVAVDRNTIAEAMLGVRTGAVSNHGG